MNLCLTQDSHAFHADFDHLHIQMQKKQKVDYTNCVVHLLFGCIFMKRSKSGELGETPTCIDNDRVISLKGSHLCPPGTLTQEVDAASPASTSFFA